jgi:hypothetical protein
MQGICMLQCWEPGWICDGLQFFRGGRELVQLESIVVAVGYYLCALLRGCYLDCTKNAGWNREIELGCIEEFDLFGILLSIAGIALFCSSLT